MTAWEPQLQAHAKPRIAKHDHKNQRCVIISPTGLARKATNFERDGISPPKLTRCSTDCNKSKETSIVPDLSLAESDCRSKNDPSAGIVNSTSLDNLAFLRCDLHYELLSVGGYPLLSL